MVNHQGNRGEESKERNDIEERNGIKIEKW
jgi:hypothetical protein